ncbi:small ribosomal subunit protein uS15m isoform X2 [Haemorhous mexicanus]|uniref:small ribosomal subunit protein uS15m isoform X2 n=1 Tax=Haemorhous mexicanus TaxID=30427 RepID=UPI0028BD4A22|nr:small ribosomal subunit protein uS15m isoform X2 [Haemorhous mexicanus]
MLALLGRGLAGPARAGAAVLGRAQPGCSPVLQAARGYARPVTKKRKDTPSHLDDLPPSMLKKDYANLPIMNSVDDVVKRLLSLEMASQDKRNRRFMLMGLDRRRKMLGYLRRVNYSTFENTCTQLGIQYSPPQPYTRHLTKRWMVKKALCIKVFQEKQKLQAAERLKKRREWQARVKAAREQREKQVQEKQVQEGTPV